MDRSSPVNNYEQRLYSVFKTFDVDNEEALSRSAVLALCDALQLESRGAALVDTLFDGREQRVTFTQFRSGLLTVLGQRPLSPTPTTATATQARSDDDSEGREVAPKFVVGSKKYGRRSRPPPDPVPAPIPVPDPASAPPSLSSSELQLDHESRVDRERALQLCRSLHMEGVDPNLVERIFESAPGGETSLGEFFERLNAALGSAAAADCPLDDNDEETLPADVVVDAWERAAVPHPRQLLIDLGYTGAAVPRAQCLQRALDDEVRALRGDAAAAPLLTAALALALLRLERVRRIAVVADGARRRMAADLASCERRAAQLAHELDDANARHAADLADALRRRDARHAEATRVADAERRAERETLIAERIAADAELARRRDSERKLRTELETEQERAAESEALATAAEARAAHADRERAQLANRLREVETQCGAGGGGPGPPGGQGADDAAAALAVRVEELRADNVRLRDRCDELCALLEAAAVPPPPPPPPAPSASWCEEVAAVGSEPTQLDVDTIDGKVAAQGTDSPAASPAPEAGAAPEAVEELRSRLAEQEERHRLEKARLDDLVQELESSLDQMRVEYERCEEYWSSKLNEERTMAAADQRAGDDRLAELAARVADYERQFAIQQRLPPIEEAPALERAAADLEAERRALQRHAQELARAKRRLQRRAAVAAAAAPPPVAPPIIAPSALTARLARAEGAVARLAARLAAADQLVKELYVENCLLGPPPPPRLL